MPYHTTLGFLGGPVEYVTSLYQELLGRTPDEGGLSAWVQAMAGGMTEAQVRQGFLDSAEYKARMSTGQAPSAYAGDAQAFVSGLYWELLGRAPDAGGLAAWVQALQSGQLTDAQVRQGFLDSPEYRARQAAMTVAPTPGPGAPVSTPIPQSGGSLAPDGTRVTPTPSVSTSLVATSPGPFVTPAGPSFMPSGGGGGMTTISVPGPAAAPGTFAPVSVPTTGMNPMMLLALGGGLLLLMGGFGGKKRR